MKKNTVKGTALMVLASGCLFGGLGCLGDIAGIALRGLPGAALSELIIDSDVAFDLFADSNDGTEPL